LAENEDGGNDEGMVESVPVSAASPACKETKPARQAAAPSENATSSPSTQNAATPITQAGHSAEASNAADASAAKAGGAEDLPRGIDRVYMCKWKNGKEHPARVVERKLIRGGQWEYYVHYEEFDRRLDEWVSADRMGEEIVKSKSLPARPTSRAH
jgi:histone acetyltransferase MYST1